MAVEQTSVQRFLQHRAQPLLIGAYSRAGFTWQIIGGSICLAIAFGLALGGAISGLPGLWAGAIGPLVAGAINLGIGLRMRKKYSQNPTEARLTPEARSFLWTLMKQTNTNWNHGSLKVRVHTPAMQAPSPIQDGETFFHQLGKHWGILPKTPKDLLTRPIHDILETACYHYNRVFGILEAGRDDSTLTKVGQGAKAGADEAIFGILHHAATMHRFPETISASSRDCEEKIRALKELADGLERIQIRPAAISERLGYTSAMDTALEEVRLERLAREELQLDSDSLRERL